MLPPFDLYPSSTMSYKSNYEPYVSSHHPHPNTQSRDSAPNCSSRQAKACTPGNPRPQNSSTHSAISTHTSSLYNSKWKTRMKPDGPHRGISPTIRTSRTGQRLPRQNRLTHCQRVSPSARCADIAVCSSTDSVPAEWARPSRPARPVTSNVTCYWTWANANMFFRIHKGTICFWNPAIAQPR